MKVNTLRRDQKPNLSYVRMELIEYHINPTCNQYTVEKNSNTTRKLKVFVSFKREQLSIHM